ncbi:hypothetical protein JZ751_025622 [Albula glossodonta]|uniref:Uncharacterized protein n=1 Tax=Albula glossodonta TaxID=121402 RepID=A0A8T2NEZ4_9TELE|nr:hypothetical protein JZ751_025622 [Albula glossodonta]
MCQEGPGGMCQFLRRQRAVGSARRSAFGKFNTRPPEIPPVMRFGLMTGRGRTNVTWSAPRRRRTPGRSANVYCIQVYLRSTVFRSISGLLYSGLYQVYCIQIYIRSTVFRSISGGALVGPYLPLLGPALGLQGSGALLHALSEAHIAVVRSVVQLGQLSQGQDVIAGDSEDSQLGQLLPVRVAGHLRRTQGLSGPCATARITSEDHHSAQGIYKKHDKRQA